MISAFGRAAKAVLRFLLLWFVDGVSLLITAAILPGLNLESTDQLPMLVVGLAAAFVLGLVNLLIRPIILLIARPLGFIAVFVVGVLVNAISLVITAGLMGGVGGSGLLSAVIAGIVFSAINVVLTGIMDVNEEGSYYQGRIERLAGKQLFKSASEPGRGLMMMEIDGLSFHHIQKALADGRLPTIQKMIEEEGYQLTRVDCGIPSQTSACQMGIMFGDNFDIPAFRWYDKDQQRLIVSGHDAAELNARFAKGNGLMRGGSSIDNMMNGDAEKSMLTLADLRQADKEQQKRRAEDVYLLMLNPYFFMRTVSIFLGAVVRELWEGWQQRRKDVYPRLNRLHGGYPFIRAATTVFVRDISANLTILDIIRGAASIYVTWPGYDEVAHHSGPWTSDAFGELARYDSTIARIKRTIEQKAPRPYDLIILSDHGQSFGPTFKMRYGITLKEFIEQLLPVGTTVAQSIGGDTGVTSLTAVSGELKNVQEQGTGNQVGRAVAKQGQKWMDDSVKQQEEELAVAAKQAQVTAYGSGNLAQVYFDLYPRRIKLSELQTSYPGVVDALLQHEGIGLVCGYEDDGTPVAIGKTGKRNLHTDEVIGDDPLMQYAIPGVDTIGAASLETRIWQVRRVMDFPHAGDLMVISTVYPDGTVAALEELIGNHGGLGGEQTDAFILHPHDMPVTPTRNSSDVFHILNNHRGTPVSTAPKPGKAITAEDDQWALANLWAGLKEGRLWLRRAVHALFLNRQTYQDIVQDGRMTGPGLLIGLVMSALAGFFRNGDSPVQGVAAHVAAWLLSVLAVFAAGRLLSHRGTFTRTMRAMGFARTVAVIDLLAFIPGLAPMANLLTFLMTIVATWMAAAQAHETKGWRTLLLPVVTVAILIIAPIVLLALLGSGALVLQSIQSAIGIGAPQ